MPVVRTAVTNQPSNRGSRLLTAREQVSWSSMAPVWGGAPTVTSGHRTSRWAASVAPRAHRLPAPVGHRDALRAGRRGRGGGRDVRVRPPGRGAQPADRLDERAARGAAGGGDRRGGERPAGG